MSICLGEINHTKLQVIRALVVDDDVVYQNLLCRLLGSRGIQVVGRASSLDQAVLLYKATRPDVVLVGLSSLDRSKAEALSKIKELDPSAKLIVLSIFNSFEDIDQEKKLIDAHVIKGSSAKEIVDTIKELALERKG